MDQTNETASWRENYQTIIDFLIKKGVSEEKAKVYLIKLSENIWLSTIVSMAKSKNFDMSQVNSLDKDQKQLFLEQNFTNEEILATMETESQAQIQKFITLFDKK